MRDTGTPTSDSKNHLGRVKGDRPTTGERLVIELHYTVKSSYFESSCIDIECIEEGGNSYFDNRLRL